MLTHSSYREDLFVSTDGEEQLHAGILHFLSELNSKLTENGKKMKKRFDIYQNYFTS